jgi:hypothetical protein
MVVLATCWLTDPCWLGLGACAHPGAFNAKAPNAAAMTTTDTALFI